MSKFLSLTLLMLLLVPANSWAQDVPILSSSVDISGRINIQIASTSAHYYVLYYAHDLLKESEHAVSIAIGQDGTTWLTESLAAAPIEHYRVVQYLQTVPADVDGDGINDMEEFQNPDRFNPLNPAPEISHTDGSVLMKDRKMFTDFSYQGLEVRIDDHLRDLEFVKFYLLDMDTDNPSVYFMNTETHRAHFDFADAIGIPSGRGTNVPGLMRGEIVYHPQVLAPSGAAGIYRFEFEPFDSYGFEAVQKAYEVLAANMLFLQNNLAYYPMPNAALPLYYEEKELYDASRVAILLEEDIFESNSFLPLNLAEGYGLLRIMELNERPNPRDIVIYEALPNELSRVGGIISVVPQTPLSHVNLRAIQDDVPNAFIADALTNPNLTSLLGKYVYYRIDSEGYVIEETTREAVEAHYINLRPAEPQIPARDLSVTTITPLDEISFEQSASFGVKTANMATLRTLNFPDETIRDGFGVPFYFYDAFMQFNGFYDQAEAMFDDPAFQEDYNIQEQKLEAFRKTIKDGAMPGWMMDALSEMQQSFPPGQSIRCRSSTNNEDLPGFSGAGLYDSKTQHPDEGHISKSIKQVYASLWNFRAFDERTFYRVDHFAAAMGVLVHPNFEDEQSNGVGVTFDPFYGTTETFYLNSQIGEDLVTNPDALSIPEEILLASNPDTGTDYTILRRSNQVGSGEQVLSATHLEQLRIYLNTIHDHFRDLYSVKPDDSFAMEIEYKVTREGALAIKQARPWVFYELFDNSVTVDAKATPTDLSLYQNFPNPFNHLTTISFQIDAPGYVDLSVYNVLGQKVRTLIDQPHLSGNYTIVFDGAKLPSGMYFYKLKINGRSHTRKMVRSR